MIHIVRTTAIALGPMLAVSLAVARPAHAQQGVSMDGIEKAVRQAGPFLAIAWFVAVFAKAPILRLLGRPLALPTMARTMLFGAVETIAYAPALILAVVILPLSTARWPALIPVNLAFLPAVFLNFFLVRRAGGPPIGWVRSVLASGSMSILTPLAFALAVAAGWALGAVEFAR